MTKKRKQSTSKKRLQSKWLESTETLSEDGLTPTKYLTLRQKEVLDSTMLINTCNNDCQQPPSLQQFKQHHSHQSHPQQLNQTIPLSTTVTAESVQLSKQTTYKGKSRKCNNNSQIIQSSQTSAQESTGSAKALDNSWIKHTKDVANKLWLPTETDCVDLHSNCLNGSFNNKESNSWFKIKQWIPQNPQNLQKISLPSLTSLTAESTVSESIKPKKEKIKINPAKKTTKQAPNQVHKIKLKFSSQDRKTIISWFGCARKTYNWASACIKAKPKEYKINMIWLRKRFINKCNMPKKYSYLLDCPKEIRDGAINDLVAAYKLNMEKRKTNPHFKYDIKFRSKKDNQSIYIGADVAGFKKTTNAHMKDWNQGQFRMFPTRLSSLIKFHTRKRDAAKVDIPKYDCRLTMDHLGDIYLHVPQFREVRCDNQTPEKIASIDPGVRTFLTVYSNHIGTAYKLGDGDIGRVMRLGYWLDKLISKSSTNKQHKQRHRLKQAILRHRQRIKNIVDEVHWKCIKFLLTNFTTIYLPSYNSSQMVLRKSRKINSKTVRMMLSWRFYAFKQRLVQQAKLYNVNIVDCTEEYTSKTCGQCHTIKNNLGGSKKYKCSECQVQIDRDLNGARNIFIKNYFTGKTLREGLEGITTF